MKTYRERLQALIETLQACYDEVGALRDYSPSKVADVLNEERDLLRHTWWPLQQLDNAIPEGFANTMTRGKGFCKE